MNNDGVELVRCRLLACHSLRAGGHGRAGVGRQAMFRVRTAQDLFLSLTRATAAVAQVHANVKGENAAVRRCTLHRTFPACVAMVAMRGWVKRRRRHAVSPFGAEHAGAMPVPCRYHAVTMPPWEVGRWVWSNGEEMRGERSGWTRAKSSLRLPRALPLHMCCS